MVARLCQDTDGGIKENMYVALRTTLTLDDALDLIEIDDVGRSWRAAEARNSDRLSAIIQKRNARET